MKLVNMLFLAIGIGLLAGAVGYNWSTTKYPSCDLVANGIGVPTFGCSNAMDSNVAQCATEKSHSQDMAACINQNYYRAKYLPFGFTQTFGDRSNMIDPKPRLLNTLAMMIFGFTLTLVFLTVRRPSLKHRPV